jgi:sortase A
VPPRFDKSNFRLPKIEWRRRTTAEADSATTGRTYTLREPPKITVPIDEIVARKRPRSFVDWRGIGILLTTREFVDRAIGITGELLISAGMFVLLFLGWHVWFNDLVQGAAQDKASATLAQQWQIASSGQTEFDRAIGSSDGAFLTSNPPVMTAAKDAEPFATLIIPRFGERYVRTIAESVDVATVLNNTAIAVGHYPSSNLLGELGNFAIAGHRTTYGAAFGWVDNLRVGDRMYIETEKGWYVYRFRNLEFVYPTEVAVLNPVPQTIIEAQESILTITTCHPKLSAAERFIAYSIFESFVPRENGTPTEVSAVVGRD